MTINEDNPGRERRWWSSLRPWWLDALAAPVTALLLAGVGATQGETFHVGKHTYSTSIALLIAAAAVSIPGGLDVLRKIRALERQVRDRNELAARAINAETGLVDIVCEELATVIQRTGLHSHARASLFLCRGDHFILVGRSSPMTQWGRSLGRGIYPLDSGVLGKAWNVEKIEDGTFADPGRNETPNKGWLDRQKKWGVKEAIASKFVMRSRAYAALRLDLNQSRLGILVLESDAQPSIGADGTSHPTIGSLEDMKSSQEILARALNHLNRLDESELRQRVAAYLPTR